MLFYSSSFDILVLIYTYLFIYNISLFVIFWTLQQFISFNFKTLHSFSDLKFNYYFVTVITISLFSMAGVPPFIGFFSKLLILLSLTNSNFFFFYIFFFGLLFFGLYFYLQNIRFLYSTGTGKINYAHSSNMRLSYTYFHFITFLVFFLTFGLFFVDEFLFYFNWLFN